MKSPQFLFVDVALLAAGFAVTASDRSCPSQATSGCAVDVHSAGPQHIVVILEGDNLPPADRVRDAMAALCTQPATAAIGDFERGWEVLYVSPDRGGD